MDDATTPGHADAPYGGGGAHARPVVLEGAPGGAPGAHHRKSSVDRTRLLYIGLGVFMVLAVLYGVDLVMSIGRVPRGTEVAGIDVGGMKREDAETKLVSELGPRVHDPVTLRAGAVSTSLDPNGVGLSVDWQGTLDRAGEQPLNPFTRLFSLVHSHEVGIASIIPDERLTSFLEKLALQADFGPREGAIWFDRAQVKSVIPMDGQQLEVEQSREDVLAHWLDENGVDLSVNFTPTETKADQVRSMVHDVAEPAATRDVTLVASRAREDGSEPPTTTVMTTPAPEPAEDGKEAKTPAPEPVKMVDPRGPDAVPATFPRDRIGEYLSFVRDGADLQPRFDADAAKGILEPELAGTEAQGRDATFSFSGDTATVVPAVRGRTVEWGPLLGALPEQMTNAAPERLVPVTYRSKDPELSTKDAENAGIRSKVGEFTVGVPANSSAQQMLAALNGHFVPAGGTLSLSQLAGNVSGDLGSDGVATALFNAGYEAGAQNLTRTQRGVTNSAFPVARDASASGDVSMRNGQKTALVVEAFGDAGSVTVRLWGTPEYTVQSSTSPRTDVRRPQTRTVTDAGCTPDSGEDGYTSRVTRTVLRGRDVVSTDTFSSTYAPTDRIECREQPRSDDRGTVPSPSPSPGVGGGVPAPAPVPGIPGIPGLPQIRIPGVN